VGGADAGGAGDTVSAIEASGAGSAAAGAGQTPGTATVPTCSTRNAGAAAASAAVGTAVAAEAARSEWAVCAAGAIVKVHAATAVGPSRGGHKTEHAGRDQQQTDKLFHDGPNPCSSKRRVHAMADPICKIKILGKFRNFNF
ncbi:MAG: hypothetical protein ACREEW_09685, partial [Caulobacteraceae bacterium]